MIKLSFTSNREVIEFSIDNRLVKYYDKNWKEGIQILPMSSPNEKLTIKKMLLSRSPRIKAQGLLIADANLGKNKEEYDKAQTDEEIAEIIKREASLKGLLIVQ